MSVDELIAMGRHFHALARMASNPATKDRLVALGDDYLEQAKQFKRQRAITEPDYLMGWRMHITDYLIETADECELIAKRGRMLLKQLEALGSKTSSPLAQISDGGQDLSERVERIAQSLLAKAVEIDHEREKKGHPGPKGL